MISNGLWIAILVSYVATFDKLGFIISFHRLLPFLSFVTCQMSPSQVVSRLVLVIDLTTWVTPGFVSNFEVY